MPTSSSATPPSLNFNEIYHLVLAKAWLIMGCIGFFLLLALAYIFLATPKYDAVATIEVLQREHQVVNVEKEQPEDYRSLDVLETVEGNLQRASLLVRVLQRPELKNNPFLAHLAQDPENPDNEGAFKGLQGAITVKLRRATRLIDVTVEHRDPETAQLLANLLVDEYIHEGFVNRSEGYQNTSDFLQKESFRMKEKLETTETQMQDYAKLVDLRQRILDERKSLDLLDQRYLEKHPKVIEAHALLADLQKQFLDEMARRKAAEAPGTAPAESPDDAKLTEDQRVEREMIEEQSRYNVITQEEATTRTMYESVLDRLKEAGISQGFQDANIREVDPAMLPHKPSKPRVVLALAIGLFLGLITGFGSVLALSFMDASLRTVDDAEEKLDLPALGGIPEIVADRRQVARSSTPVVLVVKDHRDSMVAEAIRTLRASIKLLGRREEQKSLLFTSAVPEEGKSFVTSNLAISLAQEGARVLLIDADLRKPTQHSIFGYPRTTPGLGEYMVEAQPFSKLVVALPTISGLSVLFAGGKIPHPAELLSKGTFPALLKAVSSEYDYVLVDSAPVHAVGDTLLFCELFQATILVIRAGRTPTAASQRAIHLLKKSGAKIVGFVLNRLPSRTGFGHNPYYYYYQSTDKYGEAYGTAKK